MLLVEGRRGVTEIEPIMAWAELQDVVGLPVLGDSRLR